MVTQPIERVSFDTRDSGVYFVKFGENMLAAYDSDPFTRPIVWEVSASPNSVAVTRATLERFNRVAPETQNLIGIYKSQLVFLNNDGWICSMSIEDQVSDKPYTRHFPVPHCWRSSSHRIRALVTPRGDVVIVKSDGLAIVQRSLNL
ncbi:hypothetical protein EPUS_08545 [Endocarpon pusillum Z07020]|uniref:Uncharacterized protein n=1 Tax=Endocarpon pusillum (strain Z07020 / HMAS-L-300199) TaxID=1263415 RepID=U1G7K0_ENDPU|nr:uncharacterized protein EPUS_08545 [Endocarpon pusillum Z07020]ERF73402.1 hypothetical protein EPUS_08545 [Endocarpon pusillum Z07020]